MPLYKAYTYTIFFYNLNLLNSTSSNPVYNKYKLKLSKNQFKSSYIKRILKI